MCISIRYPISNQMRPFVEIIDRPCGCFSFVEYLDFDYYKCQKDHKVIKEVWCENHNPKDFLKNYWAELNMDLKELKELTKEKDCKNDTY